MKKKCKQLTLMKETKLLTKGQQFILASESETRKKKANETFQNLKIVKHKINEQKEKSENKKKPVEKLVEILARKKAESLKDEYPDQIIIGSDQILECNGKIINKPKNLIEAKKNIQYLSGKKHRLFSSISVIKNSQLYFEETKKAELLFKQISSYEIDRYIKHNKDAALNSVGSYRIEDNDNYKFLYIINGDIETIIGFPMENFLKKLKEEYL